MEIEYRPTGMNNVDNPADVGAQVPKIRQLIFTEAVNLLNVDTNNTGGVSLRPGRVASLRATGLHSGWSNPYDPKEAYFVNGSLLNRINPDGSITTVKYDLIPGLDVSFCQVNDVTVYSNGLQFGVIENGVDADPFSPTAPYKQRMIGSKFMDFYNGRLYSLVDNFSGTPGCALICSDSLDVPGGIESMDERQNVVAVFTGMPKMLIKVEAKAGGGLFVSAGDETFWLEGRDAVLDGGFAAQESVAPYAAIPGPAIPLKSELIGIQGLSGNCVMWASTRGVCLGAAGGYFANLTQSKVSYPADGIVTAMLREMNGLAHFMFVIQGATDAPYNDYQPIA